MIDFLKSNIAGILALVLVAGLWVAGGDEGQGGVTNFDSLTLSGTLTTADVTASDDVTVSDALDVDGNTTVDHFVKGGATSSATSTSLTEQTLVSADVCDYTVFKLVPETGNLTLTFPTSALLFADCIPNIGDEWEFLFRNGSTTGTAAITIADGSGGIHLEGESETTVVDVAEWAWIRLKNLDGSNYVLDVEVRQDAD